MLRGFTLGVTADRRWEEQAALFERRGASVQHGPAIRTLPLGSDRRLRDATEAVIAERPAVVVANTALGVRSWFSSAESWGLGDELTATLARARIFARGPKASGAVHAFGLDIEGQATTERLRDAVDLALGIVAPGDLVALVLDGRATSEESVRLRAAGAAVIEVPVYRWALPDDLGPALRLAESVVAGRIHAVTFTSGPTVGNWMAMADEHGIGSALRAALTDGRVVVGCMGPVCAEAAAAAGLASPHLVVPRTWRLGPLVRAVTERLADRILTLEVDGSTMVITGNVVSIDADPIALTDTEARVLSLLASRPNVAHTKAELLRIVWRDEAADPHVVEAAVTRMRRRMGPLGARITSVYRRGYVLNT